MTDGETVEGLGLVAIGFFLGVGCTCTAMLLIGLWTDLRRRRNAEFEMIQRRMQHNDKIRQN